MHTANDGCGRFVSYTYNRQKLAAGQNEFLKMYDDDDTAIAIALTQALLLPCPHSIVHLLSIAAETLLCVRVWVHMYVYNILVAQD